MIPPRRAYNYSASPSEPMEMNEGGGWLRPPVLERYQGYLPLPAGMPGFNFTKGQGISGLQGDWTTYANQGFSLTPILIGFGIGAMAVLALALGRDEPESEVIVRKQERSQK